MSALGQLGSNIFIPGLPQIEADFGSTASQAAATYTVYLLVLGIAQLFAGPLADRFGRRPVALGSVALFLVGSLACAFAPTLVALLTARVVQAVGAAGALVVSRAVARDRFEGAELVRVITAIMMAFALVPGFAPMLGGVLTSVFGWRSTLLACAVMALLTLLLLWRSLTESLIIAPFSAARSPSALRIYGLVLGNRVYLRMALIAGIAFGGLLAFFGASSRLYIGLLNLSAVQFGFFPAVIVSGFFAGAIFLRRNTGRISDKRLLLLGTTAQLIAVLIMLAPVAAGWLSHWPLNVGIFLYVAALGLLSPLASASAMNSQTSHAGQASALLGFSQMLAGALGAWLANTLSDWSAALGMQLAMLVLVLINLVLALTYAPTATKASES